MLAYFYDARRLKKNNLVGQIVYKSLNPKKRRHSKTYFMKHFNFSPSIVFTMVTINAKLLFSKKDRKEKRKISFGRVTFLRTR